ncbi:MAG TPA: hypothetical protein VFV38_32125 [Ktedonobacteraceae bacterium]|nr:hypothetical protein [Ktedonobacteraceae bacterium]
MVPPLLDRTLQYDPSYTLKQCCLSVTPANGGDPASFSLALSGGFNTASMHRLALSRLASWLYQCLLILFNALIDDVFD